MECTTRNIYGNEHKCGKCMACRLTRQHEWVGRMTAELHLHAHTVFTTLTYDEEHLPEDGSVNKRDPQLFLKRLRNELKRKEGREFRYYLCAEYGDQKARPHYHAVLFGISMADSAKIQDAWRSGITQTSPINDKRIAYVAKYVQKTVIKSGVEFHEDNKRKEFALMSRNPGLGRDFLRAMAIGISRAYKNAPNIRLHGCMRVAGKKYYFDRYSRNLLIGELVDMGIHEEKARELVSPDAGETTFSQWECENRQRDAGSFAARVEAREKIRSISRRSI